MFKAAEIYHRTLYATFDHNLICNSEVSFERHYFAYDGGLPYILEILRSGIYQCSQTKLFKS